MPSTENPSDALAPFRLAQISVRLHTQKLPFLTFAKIHPHFTFWSIELLSLYSPLFSLCSARVNLSAYGPYGSTRIQRLIYDSHTRGGWAAATATSLVIPAVMFRIQKWIWLALPILYQLLLRVGSTGGGCEANQYQEPVREVILKGCRWRGVKSSHCGQTDGWMDRTVDGQIAKVFLWSFKELIVCPIS